jgi:hypothetical protein
VLIRCAGACFLSLCLLAPMAGAKNKKPKWHAIAKQPKPHWAPKQVKPPTVPKYPSPAKHAKAWRTEKFKPHKAG